MRSSPSFGTGVLLTVAVALLGLAPAMGADAAAPDGWSLYREKCQDCHGKEGQGDGPKAKRLGFYPRDFSRAAFKCRCTPSGELPTAADLERSITHGLAGTPMPAHADLTPAQVGALIEVVSSFSPRFAAEPPAPCIEIPDPPEPTEKSIASGKQLYRILQCFKCHGKSGGGDGPSAQDLVDEWGRKIRPGRVATQRLKCGADAGDLFRTLRTGINGSPMPSFGEAFLFDAESVAVGPTIESEFGAAAAAELRAYLEVQPDRARLDAMTEGERRALVDARTWAVVGYLISLRAAP